MSFDVPKLVRCPGYDHEHDEESRNGRDIKIDILDGYIRTPEVFRVKRDFSGVPGGYRNPPGVIGPTWALSEKRRADQGRPRAPSPLVQIGQGEEAGTPPSFSLSFSPLPNPIPTRKGGNPTPGGSRTPPGAPSLAGRTPPLDPLYTGAGGTPKTQQLIS